MKTYTMYYTCDLGELGERELTIDFSYSPGRAGKMYDRFGDPGDPPEGMEYEIHHVFCESIDITKLCQKQFEESEWFYFEMLEFIEGLKEEEQEAKAMRGKEE